MGASSQSMLILQGWVKVAGWNPPKFNQATALASQMGRNERIRHLLNIRMGG